MADGKLKLLNCYAKIHNMSMYLAQHPTENRFYNMDFLNLTTMATRLSAEANRLYGSSQNGQNYASVKNDVSLFRLSYGDLAAGLENYRTQYLNSTSNPDPQFMQMLTELGRDMAEDQMILQEMRYDEGMSLQEAVYQCQKRRENERQGMREEGPELPGYDTVHGQNYPGENTLYGQNYPGFDTVNSQNYPGQNTLYGQNAPGGLVPTFDLPSQNTVLMHEGAGNNIAVEPYMQQQFYGSNTFYQNDMTLPNLNAVQQDALKKQKAVSKNMQMLTVWPLSNAILDAVPGDEKILKNQMNTINMELQALFNTMLPYNPLRDENRQLQEPQMPDLRAAQDMGVKMKAVHLHLTEWKNYYQQTAKAPSDQVVFMADNILRKLEDDYMVLNGMKIGEETLPQAAFRLQKLPRHFGLEKDRKTPVKCPQKKFIPQQVDLDEDRQGEDRREIIRPLTDLNLVQIKLKRAVQDLADSDPSWMWSSSGEYGEMKKSLETLQTFVKKNPGVFRKDGDFSSPEYKKTVKEYKSLLDASAEKTLKYLEKKESDFEKDPARKEAIGSQKWEQLRIRTALHSYDTILALRGNVRMSIKEEDQNAMAEGFKNVLLSNESKRIYEVESEAVKAERPGTVQNAQPSL